MAYLLALMFTGVTVVRKGCGGGGDSTPAPTSSICLMPSLSTAALIALSIDRRSRRVTLSWWQNVWISTNLGPKNMAEKKWKDDFSVQDCTQEQNGSLYFFFHRSAIQKAVSVENDLWDPEILRPWYYLTSHFSTLFSVIIAAVVFVTWVEGKY